MAAQDTKDTQTIRPSEDTETTEDAGTIMFGTSRGVRDQPDIRYGKDHNMVDPDGKDIISTDFVKRTIVRLKQGESTPMANWEWGTAPPEDSHASYCIQRHPTDALFRVAGKFSWSSKWDRPCIIGLNGGEGQTYSWVAVSGKYLFETGKSQIDFQQQNKDNNHDQVWECFSSSDQSNSGQNRIA